MTDIKDGLVPMIRDGLKKVASRFHNEKSGITGLETAIVGRRRRTSVISC